MLKLNTGSQTLFAPSGSLADNYRVYKSDNTNEVGAGSLTDNGHVLKVIPLAGELDVLGPVEIDIMDAGGVTVFMFFKTVVTDFPGVPGGGGPVELTAAYDACKTAAQAGDLMGLANGAITDAKITLPAVAAGPATGALGMILQVWRFFFKRKTRDASTIKGFANDGTTVLLTQNYTSGGSNEDVTAAT